MGSGLLYIKTDYVKPINEPRKSSKQKLLFARSSLIATSKSRQIQSQLAKVLTRSHPQGRAKIQDRWNSKVYKVADRRDNVYEIEPTDGQGSNKVVNRAELQVCSKPRPQPTRLNPQRKRVPAPRPDQVTSDDSSDEYEDIEISLGAPGKSVPIPAEPDRPPLRRSARLNKGRHSNPHHQPKTVV